MKLLVKFEFSVWTKITILFIALKLIGYFPLNWFYVFYPTYISIFLAIALYGEEI